MDAQVAHIMQLVAVPQQLAGLNSGTVPSLANLAQGKGLQAIPEFIQCREHLTDPTW